MNHKSPLYATTYIIAIVSNVGFGSKRPWDIQSLLLLLQQKHDENKDGVEHEEGVNHLISQTLQVLLYLLLLVLTLGLFGQRRKRLFEGLQVLEQKKK